MIGLFFYIRAGHKNCRCKAQIAHDLHRFFCPRSGLVRLNEGMNPHLPST